MTNHDFNLEKELQLDHFLKVHNPQPPAPPFNEEQTILQTLILSQKRQKSKYGFGAKFKKILDSDMGWFMPLSATASVALLVFALLVGGENQN